MNVILDGSNELASERLEKMIRQLEAEKKGNRENLIFDDLYIPETVELSEQERAEIEGFLKKHIISITDTFEEDLLCHRKKSEK